MRDEADEKDKDTLMIWRVSKGNRYIQQGTVQVVSKGTFANYWFKKFIKDNDIKDANGDYYNLTSHQSDVLLEQICFLRVQTSM